MRKMFQQVVIWIPSLYIFPVENTLFQTTNRMTYYVDVIIKSVVQYNEYSLLIVAHQQILISRYVPLVKIIRVAATALSALKLQDFAIQLHSK